MSLVLQLFTILEETFRGGQYICSLLNFCGPDEVDVRVEKLMQKRTPAAGAPAVPVPAPQPRAPTQETQKEKTKRTKRQADLIKFAHVGDTHVEPNYSEVSISWGFHASFISHQIQMCPPNQKRTQPPWRRMVYPLRPSGHCLIILDAVNLIAGCRHVRLWASSVLQQRLRGRGAYEILKK